MQISFVISKVVARVDSSTNHLVGQTMLGKQNVSVMLALSWSYLDGQVNLLANQLVGLSIHPAWLFG